VHGHKRASEFSRERVNLGPRVTGSRLLPFVLSGVEPSLSASVHRPDLPAIAVVALRAVGKGCWCYSNRLLRRCNLSEAVGITRRHPSSSKRRSEAHLPIAAPRKSRDNPPLCEHLTKLEVSRKFCRLEDHAGVRDLLCELGHQGPLSRDVHLRLLAERYGVALTTLQDAARELAQNADTEM